MKRDLEIADLEGLLHSHAQRFAEAQFAELNEPWHPVTPVVDAAMTVGVFLLALSPVLIVLGFKFL